LVDFGSMSINQKWVNSYYLILAQLEKVSVLRFFK